MIITNPCAITLDSVEYPVTPIIQKWFDEKIDLKVLQKFQWCYILGDGRVSAMIPKKMMKEV